MTTEDDFQTALDAEPSNHALRMVFADWLEEQGDKRAEGYRVLGGLGKYAYESVDEVRIFCFHNGEGLSYDLEGNLPDHCLLHQEWIDWTTAFERGEKKIGYRGRVLTDCRWNNKRRVVESTAALAWNYLPSAVKDEILSSVTVGNS